MYIFTFSVIHIFVILNVLQTVKGILFSCSYLEEMTVAGCFEKKMKIFVLRFYIKIFFSKKKRVGGKNRVGRVMPIKKKKKKIRPYADHDRLTQGKLKKVVQNTLRKQSQLNAKSHIITDFHFFPIVFLSQWCNRRGGQGGRVPPRDFPHEVFGDKLGKKRQGKSFKKMENVEKNEEKWKRE